MWYFICFLGGFIAFPVAFLLFFMSLGESAKPPEGYPLLVGD